VAASCTAAGNRWPHELLDEVFQFKLKFAVGELLISGKTVGGENTTLQTARYSS
jgi:hypothetical protein